MDHPLDETTQHRVIGFESVQLDALRPAHLSQQLRRCVLIQLEPTEQRRRDRRPHVGFTVGSADTREERDLPTGEGVERFGDQPGLAGTGLAGDRDDRATPVGHHRHDRCEQLPLGRATHERKIVEPCADGGKTPPATGDPPDTFGLFAAAYVERVDRLGQDLLGGERGGRVADQDSTRLGQCLQPRGHVDDVAHRGVLGRSGHVPDDDFAGVDTDTQLQRAIEIGLLGHEAGKRLVHLHRCTNGPVGIVLVGDRSAEEGENPVAEHLVDATAERGDVGDQPLEAGIDQAFHTLGIEMLGQRGVADQVGEDDGDDSTFLGNRRRNLVSARWTEPCAVRKRCVARRAGGHQPVIVRHVHPAPAHDHPLGGPRSTRRGM